MTVELSSKPPVITSRRILWGLVGATGGLGLLGGLLGIALAFWLPLNAGDSIGVMLSSVGLLTALFGSGLLWAGLTGWRQSPAPNSHTRWGWLVFLGLSIIALVIGALIPGDRHYNPAFALLHVGVMFFPAATLMALILQAAGRTVAPTLRQMALTVVGGAASVILALPLELFAFVVCVLLVFGVAAVVPGGADEVARLSAMLEQWQTQPPADADAVLTLVGSPLVLITLTMIFAIVAPLIEEFGKTLVLGLMGIWQRPGLLGAFLWGAMCGLGFAVLENITNGAMGLGEVAGWLSGTGARMLATGMHILTSGLLGLGWAGLWQRRWWALPLAYCVAVFYHGLWNLNIVLAVSGAALGLTTSSAAYVLMLIGVGFEIVLILAMPLLLFGIPIWLRRYTKQEI